MANWTPLRDTLADVAVSTTFAWTELDALVGGLPKSAYVHNAFWRGDRSGWPGFTTTEVKVGKSVTFVRIGERPGNPPAPEAKLPSVPSAETAPDLVLVGCVKQKLAVPAAAKDLYLSALFRKERAYAEQTGAPWFVLSAEHGLVHPDEVLAPYDLQLSKMPCAYRRAWGARVAKTLEAESGPLTGKKIEVHAGSAYADAVRPLLTEAGAQVTEPLAGLRLGPRLAWYGQSSNTTESTVPLEPAPDVAALTERLTGSDSAMSPGDFLATGGDGLRSRPPNAARC